MTFKQFKADPEKAIKELGNIIYCHKPYVILNEGVIMSSGNADHFTDMAETYGTYYDHCEFKLREHNLHMNDNRKATLPVFI